MRTASYWSTLLHSAAVSVVLMALSACSPDHPRNARVVGVFGGVGLGPGEFSYPRAITAEPDGCVFVVDKSGRVQRFSADGEYETEWQTPATRNGKPVGLSIMPDQRLFVADTHYHRVLVYDRDGTLLDEFGRHGNGPGEFQLPTDVARDDQGNYYVSEYHDNDRITKWSKDLEFLQAIGEEPIEGERLSRPAGIAVDDEQTLWLADACNHRIIRFSLDGEVLKVFGSFGSAAGQLRYPYDIDVSPDGMILVCEFEGSRLQWFTKEGESVATWGRPGRGAGELFAPWGAAYGPGGRVYVVDSLNSRIQIIKP